MFPYSCDRKQIQDLSLNIREKCFRIFFILSELTFQRRESGGSQCTSAKTNSLSKCSPSPHLLPLSVFTPLPARLQMANAIFDVFSFAHQTRGHSCTVPKPAADVSAQLPDNRRRWNTSLRLEVKSTKKKQKNKCCFSQKLFWLPRVSR